MKIIFQKWKTSFISKAKINAKSIQRFFNQWKYRYICQICYEITPSRVKFKCGHSMCKVCSNKWFKKSPDNINRIKNGYDVKMSCHICRGEVKKNDTIIVYNRQYINDYDIIHYLEENFISGIIAIEFNNVPMYGTCNKFKLIAIIIDSANKLIDIYRTIRGEKGMRYAEYFIEEVVDMLDYKIEIKEFIADHFRFKLYPSEYRLEKHLEKHGMLLGFASTEFGKVPDDWRNKCEILNNYHEPDEWNCSKCGERCNVDDNDSKCARCNTKIPNVSNIFGSEWICCHKCYGSHIDNCQLCGTKKPEYEYRPFFSTVRYMEEINSAGNPLYPKEMIGLYSTDPRFHYKNIMDVDVVLFAELGTLYRI